MHVYYLHDEMKEYDIARICISQVCRGGRRIKLTLTIHGHALPRIPRGVNEFARGCRVQKGKGVDRGKGGNPPPPKPKKLL